MLQLDLLLRCVCAFHDTLSSLPLYPICTYVAVCFHTAVPSLAVLENNIIIKRPEFIKFFKTYTSIFTQHIYCTLFVLYVFRALAP
jgi:hypothetical protein